MGLAIADRWIWDFWLADDGDAYHLFYLQAPKSLIDPDRRHRNATIGHAVSEDLVRWRVLGTALRPGPAGAWDDVATWTGSVVRGHGVWHLFYTGATVESGKIVQRVGLATSTDLMQWSKAPEPVIEADARWYEKADEPRWYEEAWRDPWVFLGTDGRFHALITARARHGTIDGRGVVGHATSDDGFMWEVGPPLSTPGEFGHLEVMQVASIGGQPALVFCSQGERISAGRLARIGGPRDDGVYVVRGVPELGPYNVADAAVALPSHLYSGRIVERRDGGLVWLAYVDHDEDGRFVGELSDPIPLH